MSGRVRRRKEQKSRAQSNAQFVRQRFAGIVLLIIIVMVLVFMLIHMLLGKDDAPLAVRHQETIAKAQVLADSSAPRAADKPKYTFYDELKKRHEEVDAEVRRRVEESEKSTVTGRNFRIQVGAFKEVDAAEQLRAKMILRDYPVTMIRNGSVYLVQIGPYAQREEALEVQKKIEREGMKTLLKAYVN